MITPSKGSLWVIRRGLNKLPPEREFDETIEGFLLLGNSRQGDAKPLESHADHLRRMTTLPKP